MLAVAKSFCLLAFILAEHIVWISASVMEGTVLAPVLATAPALALAPGPFGVAVIAMETSEEIDTSDIFLVSKTSGKVAFGTTVCFDGSCRSWAIVLRTYAPFGIAIDDAPAAGVSEEAVAEGLPDFHGAFTAAATAAEICSCVAATAASVAAMASGES